MLRVINVGHPHCRVSLSTTQDLKTLFKILVSLCFFLLYLRCLNLLILLLLLLLSLLLLLLYLPINQLLLSLCHTSIIYRTCIFNFRLNFVLWLYFCVIHIYMYMSLNAFNNMPCHNCCNYVIRILNNP